MKRILIFLSAVLLLMHLTATAQQIIFTPQWTPQSQFAGYYAAYENGYYKEAGLDVRIVHPTKSYSTLNRLEDGSCNIITQELIQAMMANDDGASLVNILQTTRHSTLVLLSRDEDVRMFEDLKGKRVGTWKVGFSEIPHMIDRKMDLGIEWIMFMNSVNLYISGAVDATLAKSYNEQIRMKMSGAKVGSILNFSDSGFDFPEDGVYVKEEFYNRYPEACKAFAEASRRGWEWVRDHREEALELSIRYAKAENVPVSVYHQKEMLDEILRVQEDTPGAEPSYVLEREAFERLNDALLHYEYIEKALDYDEFVGNKEGRK